MNTMRISALFPDMSTEQPSFGSIYTMFFKDVFHIRPAFTERNTMAADPIDNEDDAGDSPERRRPLAPRFGPFVTIAVAILLLFGAASRFGKTSPDGGWLDLDFLASKSLERETARRQEQRNATLITLGAVPSPVDAGAFAPDAPARALALAENVVPPVREVDFASYSQLSANAPTESNHHPGANEAAPRFDPAPEAKPLASGGDSGDSALREGYTVKQGDNWVKIGKQAGKRWQDIQKANPQAASGLRVGMKLTIP